MAELRVYEKRTCTTCKQLATMLEERGIDFDRVDYRVEPLTEDEIRELVRKTGRPVVVRGDRAVLARPVERVLDLLA
jgi:arsenate reductase (glutaredoxin)